MGLEERIQKIWDDAKAGGPAEPLLKILNLPATQFNEEKLKAEPTIEAYLRVADRYLPLSDTDSEEKFRAYLETYKRLRGRLSPRDILAFFRVAPTLPNVTQAESWLAGKTPYPQFRKAIGVK